MPRKYNKDDVLVTLDTFSKVAGKTKESTDYLEYEIREGISTPLVIVIRASESYQGATFTATSKVDGRSYSDTLDGDFLYLRVKSPGEYTVSNSHDENTMTALVGDPLQEEVYFTDFYGTIDVSVDELLIGETIEATNGETKVEKLAETNTTTLSVYKSGEWNVGIKGTEAVEKKQVTLSDMGESKSCRLEVTESTPTITVTLAEELKGESVTLKKSEYIRTKTAKENTVKFFVPEQGEWVVHLTASEAIREQVNVNDNKNFDCTLDLEDLSVPVLIVRSKAEDNGKIIKVSRADVTIEKVLTDRQAVYVLPTQGEWTVSCDDYPDVKKTQLCDENKIYHIAYRSTIFGIKVIQSEPDPKRRIQVLEDTELYGLRPISVDKNTGIVDYGDMESTFLFQAMNHCVLLDNTNGNEIELNPNDYSMKKEGGTAPSAGLDTNYNTFAKVDKLYMYEHDTAGIEYYYISDDKVDENYDAIGFTLEDNSEADAFYTGTFLCTTDSDSKTRSVSGEYIWSDIDFTTYINAARKNGDGYTLDQHQMINFYEVAFLMMFQNFDAKNAIGVGRDMLKHSSLTNRNKELTGFANQKGPIAYDVTSGAIKFMHVEDFWFDGGYSYVEGLITQNSTAYVRMKPPYISTASAGRTTYTHVSGTYPGKNEWVTACTVNNNWGRIPSKDGGSSSTYEGATWTIVDNSVAILHGMLRGLQTPFTKSMEKFDDPSAMFVARLAYLPPAK